MKRIKDLKTRDGGVNGFSQDAFVEEAVGKFVATDVSSLVVYDGEKRVGIFTKSDPVRCCAQRPDGIRILEVGQYMKRNPYAADIHDNRDEVMHLLSESVTRGTSSR